MIALHAHLLPHLERLGALAGGVMDELAATADKNPPTLSVRSRAGTDEFAPGMLLRAQEKLDLSTVAAADRRYGDARRLAEEAAIDARLAAITARAREARHAVNGVEASTQALQESMARDVRPGAP